jgi:DNA-binding NtrC family response regulator
MNNSDKQYKLLLVDDEKAWSNNLKDELGMLNLEVIYEEYAKNALKRIREVEPDAVLLDVLFKQKNKEEPPKEVKPTFDQIKAKYTELPVIMITNTEATDTYVPVDYTGSAFSISKGLLKPENVQTYVAFAKKIRKAIEGTENIENNIAKFKDLGIIVGNSKAMRDACSMVLKVKDTRSNVLITGETGTGKEGIARVIHYYNNKNSEEPFIAINCASFSEELLESELFGHEKGAFTGAVNERKGRFELADNGTLFLDEIGEISLYTQAKILRVLEERSFERVGGTDTLKVNLRLISATNKNLPQEIEKGKFREDLYPRLNTMQIDLPPLRERMEDIEILYEHFVNKLKDELNMKYDISAELHPSTKNALKSYSWPNNIRELRNSIERAMLVRTSSVLMEKDFSLKGSLENIENNVVNINEIVQEILDGNHKEERNLKLCEGNPYCRSILKGVIDELVRKTGKIPSFRDLTKLFDIGYDSMRQQNNKYGLPGLRNWPID